MFANNNRKLVKCLPVLAHKQGELLMRLPNHRMPNWFLQNMIKLLSNHGWARWPHCALAAVAFCNFWHLARFCEPRPGAEHSSSEVASEPDCLQTLRCGAHNGRAWLWCEELGCFYSFVIGVTAKRELKTGRQQRCLDCVCLC